MRRKCNEHRMSNLRRVHEHLLAGVKRSDKDLVSRCGQECCGFEEKRKGYSRLTHIKSSRNTFAYLQHTTGSLTKTLDRVWGNVAPQQTLQHGSGQVCPDPVYPSSRFRSMNVARPLCTRNSYMSLSWFLSSHGIDLSLRTCRGQQNRCRQLLCVALNYGGCSLNWSAPGGARIQVHFRSTLQKRGGPMTAR